MTAPASASRLTALSALLVAAACYASAPLFLRHFAGENLDAWTVNGLRYTVAALFWLPSVVLLRRAAIRRGLTAQLTATLDPGASIDRIWRDALLPASFNTIGQILWAICPYYIDAPVMGFATRLSFLFTLLFGFLLIREERPLMRQPLFYVGVAASCAGLVILFWLKMRGAVAHPLTLGAAILMIATTGFFGAYGVLVRVFMAPYSARLSFGVISLYTAPVLVILALFLGDIGRLATLSPRLWAMLIASALISIAFAHVLYYRGMQRLGPIAASGVLLLTPFGTLLGAAVLLHEILTRGQLLGGGAIVAGGAFLLAARARCDRQLPGPAPAPVDAAR